MEQEDFRIFCIVMRLPVITNNRRVYEDDSEIL